MAYTLRGHLEEAKTALKYLEDYLKGGHPPYEAHRLHFLNEAQVHIQASLDILDNEVAKAVEKKD